ncbi:hypothetical protein ACIA71_34755 [Streptomyces anulatus]|uniref:hypothetical protein n=1 Tax=Streptomyces anulatus TaxID=1892 RepID=UPI001C5ED6D9|nr:hypothetical protein [Streptomyces anulatus]QYA96274.1 hypothetical protein KZO11_22910 [Streptomyces anulatus]WSW84987.1 hypothetical protein OG536_23270 [Streptomyces anulatus]
MPTPERAAQPRPTPSALSMKALLASCAAATAVSTPPSDAPETSGAADRDEEGTHPETTRRRAA